MTAILGAVNVIATYFAFRWIDKVGRRPLAMWGYAGMAVFILVAAAGVGFLTGVPKTVLVMVGFSFFITSFAIGVGGTGWLIQGEVFPTAVRGRAAAIGASVDWIANFALIEVFPAWHNAIGLGWVMVCFAVIAVLAIGFVYRWLPETKGLSVEQAVSVFERQAGEKGGGRVTERPARASHPAGERGVCSGWSMVAAILTAATVSCQLRGSGNFWPVSAAAFIRPSLSAAGSAGGTNTAPA